MQSTEQPFTLLSNDGTASCDLDLEDIRILILAISGFQLTSADKDHIEEFFVHLIEEYNKNYRRRQ